MIDLARFELIKMKYGHFASWAIWADEGEKPKDNVGELGIFDVASNAGLLRQLNPEIILVGLNISRSIEVPLANFHDGKPQAMDYKIRYALKGSPFWGAYMTDIIKDFEQIVSGKMMSYLKTHKQFEEKNIEIFREEMCVLRSDSLTLIAFGRDADLILNRNVKNEFKILKNLRFSRYPITAPIPARKNTGKK